jgi:predicted MFS family arabinose efflux permease
LGYLYIEQLYIVALLMGFLSAWFDAAYQSYLPSLVDREHLIEGNSKLNVSNSAADVAGPALAGFVIQVLNGAVAIAIDAFSFLVSGVSLLLIRKPEPPPSFRTGQSFGSALSEGLVYVWRSEILRAFTCTNATFMFSIGIAEAVSLLYLTRTLQFTPAAIGLIFSVSSIGGLVGALAAGRLSKWLKLGPTIITASFLRGIGLACVPLVMFLPTGRIALIAVLYCVHSFGWAVWAVTQSSVRQSLAPHRLQGRVTASFLFIVRGATPLGALAGGSLGDFLGITPTFIIAGIGLLLSTVWLLISPLWALKEQPPPIEELSAGIIPGKQGDG